MNDDNDMEDYDNDDDNDVDDDNTDDEDDMDMNSKSHPGTQKVALEILKVI